MRKEKFPEAVSLWHVPHTQIHLRTGEEGVKGTGERGARLVACLKGKCGSDKNAERETFRRAKAQK